VATEAERATEPKQADRSLKELFGDVTSEVTTLLRQEVALARVELRDEAQRAGKAAGGFAGAGFAGWMSAVLLSLAVAWLLDQAMNRALAFALVGIAWAVAALILFKIGRREMRNVRPLPKTTESIKEDVRWLNEQKS